MTQPQPEDERGRVVPFRRPGSAPGHPPRIVSPPSPPDLRQFEGEPEQPDDFRHRMAMNALALLITAALIGGGLWIVDIMAHIRKDQDCVLSGRAGCTKVEAPPQPR